jgi:clathrin heavy chain
MLYSCYPQIRADVVLELAWRHGIVDNVMPFMIQTFREYDDRLNDINNKLEEKVKVKFRANPFSFNTS